MVYLINLNVSFPPTLCCSYHFEKARLKGGGLKGETKGSCFVLYPTLGPSMLAFSILAVRESPGLQIEVFLNSNWGCCGLIWGLLTYRIGGVSLRFKGLN